MRILVTGNNGYLGSLLVPQLVKKGWDVVGLDTGFYDQAALFHQGGTVPKTWVEDLRRCEAKHFEGIDSVVHMAELSNDPLGQLAPELTMEINHQGSVHLAELARRAGVRRFIYMSSCSVYGVAEGELIHEQSAVNPQTAYAVCKTLVERDLKKMAGADFSPVFLRNATAYGASPRMRFDIVLNNLAGLAWTTRSIKMTSDGSPWRPLVHGLDIARAVIEAISAPRDAVHDEVFNVGDTNHNYRVREIAEIVGEVFPGCEVSFGPPSGDNRSYRVSFEKIRKHLPDFRCEWDARKGAEELRSVFERIAMTEPVFQERSFTRLKQLEHLIRTKQLDEHFFWRD